MFRAWLIFFFKKNYEQVEVVVVVGLGEAEVMEEEEVEAEVFQVEEEEVVEGAVQWEVVDEAAVVVEEDEVVEEWEVGARLWLSPIDMKECSLQRVKKMLLLLRIWFPVKLYTMRRKSLFRCILLFFNLFHCCLHSWN